MIIKQLVPFERSVELDELVQAAQKARCLAPFSAEIINLGDELSDRLFKDPAARRFPELQALALNLRKATSKSLEKHFHYLQGERKFIRVPAGKVFHFAPGNVDTLFAYSWMLSALCGNINILRLSQRASEPVSIICRLLNEVLANKDKTVTDSVLMVTYGHEKEATERLSAICDVRVIWGGDATIATIRQAPLPVAGRELVFPDRISLSVIEAARYLQLDAEAKKQLAHDFFNDSYWFDQAACSSPLQIFWCGEAGIGQKASRQFYSSLDEELRRRDFRLESGAVVRKLTDVFSSLLEAPVTALDSISNELAVLQVGQEQDVCLPKMHAHRGSFYNSYIESLDKLAAQMERKVQTVAYFGFEKEELVKFIEQANGSGVDRLVPIGQALAFDSLWDGYDLVSEFTRLVHYR